MKKSFLGILAILAGFYLPKPAFIFLPHSQIVGLVVVLMAMVAVFGGFILVMNGLFSREK